MTFTKADRQRMAEGGLSYGEDSGVQLIAMMAAGHVNPVVTVSLSREVRSAHIFN